MTKIAENWQLFLHSSVPQTMKCWAMTGIFWILQYPTPLDLIIPSEYCKFIYQIFNCWPSQIQKLYCNNKIKSDVFKSLIISLCYKVPQPRLLFSSSTNTLRDCLPLAVLWLAETKFDRPDPCGCYYRTLKRYREDQYIIHRGRTLILDL